MSLLRAGPREVFHAAGLSTARSGPTQPAPPAPPLYTRNPTALQSPFCTLWSSAPAPNAPPLAAQPAPCKGALAPRTTPQRAPHGRPSVPPTQRLHPLQRSRARAPLSPEARQRLARRHVPPNPTTPSTPIPRGPPTTPAPQTPHTHTSPPHPPPSPRVLNPPHPPYPQPAAPGACRHPTSRDPSQLNRLFGPSESAPPLISRCGPPHTPTGLLIGPTPLSSLVVEHPTPQGLLTGPTPTSLVWARPLHHSLALAAPLTRWPTRSLVGHLLGLICSTRPSRPQCAVPWKRRHTITAAAARARRGHRDIPF